MKDAKRFLLPFPQLNINAEQKLEIDRLKRELEVARADLTRANSNLQSREVVRVLRSNSSGKEKHS